jgi:hypothetical protein
MSIDQPWFKIISNLKLKEDWRAQSSPYDNNGEER